MVVSGNIGQTNRPLTISSINGLANQYFTNMNLQEVVIYNNDKSADRSTITTNINTFFATGLEDMNAAEIAQSSAKTIDKKTEKIKKNVS